MASRITARRRRGRAAAGPVAVTPPCDLLTHRCRSLVRRGRHRQAAQIARQLANRDQTGAAWVRLGAVLARCARTEASIDAFKQGWWVFRQDANDRRAQVVLELIERVRAARSAA